MRGWGHQGVPRNVFQLNKASPGTRRRPAREGLCGKKSCTVRGGLCSLPTLLTGTAAHPTCPQRRAAQADPSERGSWPVPSLTGSTAAGRWKVPRSLGLPAPHAASAPPHSATQESAEHFSPKSGRGFHAFSERWAPFRT